MIKQTFLGLLLGPAGLSYISVQAALFVTLIVLLLILWLNSYSLHIILLSFPASILIGLALVRAHNRKFQIKNFSVSTYIGRVSCQIEGKTAVKRSYHKLLHKARWRNRINAHASSVLGALCVLVSAIIAAPVVSNQVTAYPLFNGSTAPVAVNPVATPVKTEITPASPGKWNVELAGRKDYKASLQADEYQKSSSGWYRPKLTLACTSNKTNLTFNTAQLLGPETSTISLAFDDAGNRKKQWGTSKDYQSAIAPRPILLARRFTKHNSVSVTYIPFGEKEYKTASFALNNSDDVIKNIRQRCAW